VSEFKREEELLLRYKDYKEKLIYFSTNRSHLNSPYFSHKKNMEDLISKNFDNYLIFKLPQIIGNGGNDDNFFNYFKKKIESREKIDVIDSYRSLLDVSDLRKICDYCLALNREIITISQIQKSKVIEIVGYIADNLNTKVYLNKIKADDEYNSINSPIIEECINFLELDRTNYHKILIKKYI
jgi:dTDP-4-dehydrorhamnose reductase